MDRGTCSTQKLNQSTINNDHLIIYHQNIRSLRRKTDELLSHLYPDLPHVICLTEHHMNMTEINLHNLENYITGAQFCRTLYGKGGVAIYVHNSLKFTNIDLCKYSKEKDIEICAIKLNSRFSTVYIIAIYRSPRGNFTYFLQTLDNVLQSLYTADSSIIICGDININYLMENEQKRRLDNMLLMYNLTGIVNFPTRINGTSASTIDNIFLDISRFEDYSVRPLLNDLSDHDAQIVTIKTVLQTQSNRIKIVRKINKHTISDFLYKLSEESWDDTFNNDDVNLMFNSFLNNYLKIFYSSFPPIRNSCGNNNKTWITLGIKTSCKRKRELFSLTRISNNHSLKQYYKTYCKILKNVIKEAKRMTYNKRILKSNNKSKTTWNIINELLGKQQSSNDIQKLIIEDNHLTNQYDIAEAFNKYFSSIIDKINSKRLRNSPTYCYLDQCNRNQHPPMVFKSFSTQEVISIIKSLKTKNSVGYDGISTKLLKISASYICSPLTYICNKSISSGTFPERLKYSTIKPLYKKGDKTEPSNYRPVSLLTSFSKVLEKALYIRLSEYINDNNLFIKQQFGFRKKSSTKDAIFKLTHEVLDALNNKTKVGGIFCNLEKAFDSVNHSLLIKKLPYYGIMGKSKLLLESYLVNRYQRVQIDNSILNSNAVSGWTTVKHGVPQGSILGPLLFLLYINDLSYAVTHNATPILFADDTSILISRPNINALKNDLTIIFGQITKWFEENSLSLNLGKTHFIQFSSKNQNYSDINITHENGLIPRVNEIKFLGLYINNTLSWSTHIDNILPKLSSACYAMRLVKPYVSQQTLKIIYYAYFHSIMSYNIIFWGHSADSIRVFRLQKRIIRILMGHRSRDSCRKLFTDLKILPQPSLYILCLLLFVNKNKELFTINNEIHNYCTRQHQNFHQPSANLTQYQKGVLCMGVKMYNSLPVHIKNESHNQKKFESVLKKFLYKNSFYSLEEFFNFLAPT